MRKKLIVPATSLLLMSATISLSSFTAAGADIQAVHSSKSKSQIISLDRECLEAERIGQTYEIRVKTKLKNLKASSSESWCIANYSGKKLILNIATNTSSSERTAIVTIEGGGASATLNITQNGFESSLADLKTDVLLTVSDAKASSFQRGSNINRTIDGKTEGIYHSNWNNKGENYFPITMDYFFDGADKIDYLIYHPRNDGGNNGNIKEFELWIASGDKPLQKYGEYDFMGANQPSKIAFEEPIENPKEIRFVVKSGAGDGQGFVTCSQMEFFKENPENFDYLSIFTDNACTDLKKGVTAADIKKIDNKFFRDLATQIQRGEYQKDFRVQEYDAYEHPSIMAQSNKTREYGLRDNPTGIYAQEGEDIVILVGEYDPSVNLGIFIQEPKSAIGGTSFVLKKGINKFKAPHRGLMYVMYNTKTGTEKPVKMNIITGTVNGYFDIAKNGRDDWQPLLDNATFEHFDVKGKKAILTFETEAFKKHTKNGADLINLYDDIVSLEQDFMGLAKYDREFKNRAHFQVVYGNNYMYATNYYTAYNNGTQPTVLSEEKLKNDIWGPAHELGHVHQTRPGLNWVGTTEVTNNIHSMLLQTTFSGRSRLMEENRYANAKKNIIDKRIAHNTAGDVFEKLVPFWQLKLYVQDALGNKDFYKDVYEQVRLNEDPQTNGECQLEFVKIACDKANLDLTDFFDKWGFLTPVDTKINDYGIQEFKITQNQIDEVKKYISKYPKPQHDNIELITDLNVADYK